MSDTATERRLAAILMADVVGYSALMGQDEVATRSRFNQVIEQVISPTVAAHGGRIVKLIGDGVLAEFPSVVDAVNCALIWQREVARLNGESDGPALVFRIGINLGDIIVEGDDIHGEGVNIAARIEALADPGGICLSRAARDQVRDRMDVSLHDLGETRVKNISRPVRVFRIETGAIPAPSPTGRGRMAAALAAVAVLAVCVAGLLWWQPWAAAPAAQARINLTLPDKPSLTVLPFVNVTDPEDALVAEAIAQDVTSYLGQVSGLFVISASSAFKYRDANIPPSQIARELGVRTIVQGRVSGREPTLQVVVELIDGQTDATLWTETFQETSGDTFALKEDITRSIARELAINVSRSSAPRRLTDSEEAYMLWYRAARALNEAPSPGAYDFARALAESALALDPEFGRARAALAYVATQYGYFGFAEDREQALQDGLRLAEQAVAQTPDDWYVHEMHGFALMNLRD